MQVMLYNTRYEKGSRGDFLFKKKKLIIRVVAIVLCAMMVLGVFSILMFTLSPGM